MLRTRSALYISEVVIFEIRVLMEGVDSSYAIWLSVKQIAGGLQMRPDAYPSGRIDDAFR